MPEVYRTATVPTKLILHLSHIVRIWGRHLNSILPEPRVRISVEVLRAALVSVWFSIARFIWLHLA